MPERGEKFVYTDRQLKAMLTGEAPIPSELVEKALEWLDGPMEEIDIPIPLEQLERLDHTVFITQPRITPLDATKIAAEHLDETLGRPDGSTLLQWAGKGNPHAEQIVFESRPTPQSEN